MFEPSDTRDRLGNILFIRSHVFPMLPKRGKEFFVYFFFNRSHLCNGVKGNLLKCP